MTDARDRYAEAQATYDKIKKALSKAGQLQGARVGRRTHLARAAYRAPLS